MVKYLNKGGVHVTADGTAVLSGETFVCDDPELCTKFPNKFEVVYPEPPTPVLKQSVDTPAPEKTEIQEAAEKGAEGITAPVLKDVTSNFPKAKEGGLAVKKDKRGWWLYEVDDEEPVNEKPLKKREVSAFITDYLKD